MKSTENSRSSQQPVPGPTSSPHLRLFAFIVLGALTWTAVAQDKSGRSESEEVQARVDELNRLAVRTQSHVMIDVEYHFSNLWFAAQNGQWDLAAFYLREAGSHLDWMVRIRPVRSTGGGGSVNLQPLRKSIEQSGFAQLATAIENADSDAFETAYRQTLTQCYACHQASGLEYLKPHVPDTPLSALMLRPD